MPRGAFNTNARFTSGSAATPASTIIGTYPSRLVLQEGILSTTAQHPDRPYWITLDEYNPQSGFSISPLLYDKNKADLVAWVDLDTPTHVVWYTDRIEWEGQPAYYRAALIPLSFVTDAGGGGGGGGDPPTPGTDCGSAPELTLDFSGDYSCPTGTTQWFKFGMTSGTTYHVRLTLTGQTDGFAIVYYGSSCESKTMFGFLTSMNPCASTTPGSNTTGFIAVTSGATGALPYTIEAGTGGC